MPVTRNHQLERIVGLKVGQERFVSLTPNRVSKLYPVARRTVPDAAYISREVEGGCVVRRTA